MPRQKKLFIQIHHDIYDSQQWRGLCWYSKLAYLRIKRKYNPNKGKHIFVSYLEMLDEMTQPTFSKAIKELSGKGFVVIEQKGGLYRRRNLYSLSEQWRLRKDFPLQMVYIHKTKCGLVEREGK